MSKRKIFNDPIYGLIHFKYEILYDLIDHPYFQRLRRISQMGLCNYIYPGAHHTRFHHAIGAVHLLSKTLDSLKSKDVDISDKEAEAACIAILLHDIGHGPYSHALEQKIVANHHESVSLLFMESLNKQFSNRLELAIQIFKGTYKKHFLHQLVSSQLDVDRLDYLTRDSFYTGVAEGVIGYDRIIKMLDVVDNQIVVEEKGIHSIEKFLFSRRIMYWQVYLHKTNVAVEQMMVKFLENVQANIDQKEILKIIPEKLHYFLSKPKFEINSEQDLATFASLDDIDIMGFVKAALDIKNFNIKYLSNCLINRKIYKCEVKNEAFSSDHLDLIRQNVGILLNLNSSDTIKLIVNKKETINYYNSDIGGINILRKDGKTEKFHEYSDFLMEKAINTRYFLCYPRFKC